MIEWISPRGLLLLVATNSAPVLVSWIAGARGSWPIDFGVSLPDGRRILGSHKTWRGVAAAVLAAGGLAAPLGLPFGFGVVFGAAAMLGDSLSSFIKRRIDSKPGAWIPGLDQLPEAALPLLLGYAVLELNAASFLGTLLVFSGLDLFASRVLGSSRPRRHPR